MVSVCISQLNRDMKQKNKKSLNFVVMENKGGKQKSWGKNGSSTSKKPLHVWYISLGVIGSQVSLALATVYYGQV